MFGCCSGDVLPILENVLQLVQEEFHVEVGEGEERGGEREETGEGKEGGV